MQLLAIDTSTETMSIAVTRIVHGQPQVWEYAGVGGAQTSLALIPGVLKLLQQATMALDELDAICFGCGPGSFTGLRTACAVAQGLAFGAGRKVLPVNTLLAVAEEARFTHFPARSSAQVVALLDARMQEMYAAQFAWDGRTWHTLRSSALVKPEALEPWLALHAQDPATLLVGNVFASYGAQLRATGERHGAMPTAAAMLRLAPSLLAAGGAVAPDDALPVYVRDQVAQTTAERSATHAAQVARVAAKLDHTA